MFNIDKIQVMTVLRGGGGHRCDVLCFNTSFLSPPHPQSYWTVDLFIESVVATADS